MKTQIALSLLLSITPVFTSAKNMNDLLSPYSAATWKSPTEGAFLYRHASPPKWKKERSTLFLSSSTGPEDAAMITKVSLWMRVASEPLTRQVCKPGGIRTSLRAKFQKESVGSTFTGDCSGMICRRFPIQCAWPSKLSMRMSPTRRTKSIPTEYTSWVCPWAVTALGTQSREDPIFFAARGSHLWWRG